MHTHPHPSTRRGVILLVVLSLLTLFAIVGLSFVLYASSAGRAAQLEREAASVRGPGLDPELLFSCFLGQLIYDNPDDETGVYSALRGHSLARTMYGAHAQGGANLTAYNGTGRFREANSPFGNVIGDYPLINYMFYPADPQLPAEQRFLRDPERLGWRVADPAAPRGPFTGGNNAGYTYPDLNRMFLAAVRASDGAVLLPSFHRPWAGTAHGKSGDFFDRNSNTRNPLWEAHTPPEQVPAWYKYTTLRPLPALNPGFPPPEDGGGDVKNLVGGPGTFRRLNGNTPEYWNNDSFWMDVGLPVMTAPDGRKYKPLFAALVTDLDNRLNVNVHGNALGANGQHRSNQGWGPWEVNLGKVLGPESNHLVQGVAMNPAAPAWEGRHGPDRRPTSRHRGNEAPTTIRPHFYAQVDFDGRDGGAVTARWELPPPGGPRGLRAWFPLFSSGFGNAVPGERVHHPALFDFSNPTRLNLGEYDRTFAISNMEALLRYGDTGSPALTADLFRLCPTNFREARARGLITTHSADLDRPGLPPWLANLEAAAYDMDAADDLDTLPMPQGRSVGSRSLLRRGLPPFDVRQDRGEYGADWRSLISSLGRVNLSRPLPPYPHMGSGLTPPFGPPLTRNANGQVALDMPFDVNGPAGPIWDQFQMAQLARQKLADDIYRRLLVVTGVPLLRQEHTPSEPRPEFLRVRRWLAQLAVNIVDYVDEDDISTPFQFYTAADSPLQAPDANRVRKPDNPSGEIQWPLYWVFGTELPRVVVNEAMAQVGKNDPQEDYRDTVRVFVELHNPFPRQVPPGTYLPDSMPVPLRMGTGNAAYAPYRVLLGTKQLIRRPTGINPVATIHPGEENDNVLGNPDPSIVRSSTTNEEFVGPPPVPIAAGPSAPADPGFAPIPTPHVPAHGLSTPTLPQGFLLLGPRQSPEHAIYDPFVPGPTPELRPARLQYVRDFPIPDGDIPPDEREYGVSVVLRRLANPYLPFDGRRVVDGRPNPKYNPYLTVDYLESVPLLPVREDPPNPVFSVGRPQPYAAHHQHLEIQTAGIPPLAHTFGRENLPGAPRFDWLTHLDRPLVSPLELLHVSGCQPYQLTQRFILPGPGGMVQKHMHRAPWLDEGLSGGASHRLYRLFDFIEAGPQAAGIAAGGRLPGRININTIWDPEILLALADAQPSNHFREADVESMTRTLLYDPATPAHPMRRTQGAMPGPSDRPFWGLGMGHFPAGDAQYQTLGGMDDTVLRLRHMLPGGHGHPYPNAELLTKVFNHLTTRSNVFAVWVTVGFFEVTDDTVRPVKLGAELGKAENRHVRHRMFAILDRTNLSIASCVTSVTQQPDPPGPLPPHPRPLRPSTVYLSSVSGTTELAATGPTINWEIKSGDTLVVGVGANQEVVEVLEVQPRLRAIRAAFTKVHIPGTPIALAHTAGAPPIFLKPTRVEGAPPNQVVSVAVHPERSSDQVLEGEYEGIPWTLRAGTRLLIDVGPDQEVVSVEGPFVVNGTAGTGTFRIAVTRPHPSDFLITNTLLGNPGPRTRFNPRDPAFAGVVRYLSVIQ